MTDLTLKTPSGDFVFTGAEVPEQIAFGGRQLLNTHKMIGGRRVVQAMGGDDAPLSWSGIFLAKSAPSRARFLDTLRKSGALCTLTWDEFRYQVVIAEFAAPYQKPFRVMYSITFTVVQDMTAPITSVPVISPLDALKSDMNRISALAACGGDSNTPGLASSLSAALDTMKGAVAPIANGLVKINAAIGQASACASEVGNLIQSSVAATAAPFG